MNYIPDIPRTAMDVFNMLPEGTLCEVIDNTLYMSPAATPNHQEVSGDIYFALREFLKDKNLGKGIYAPCDVYLNDEQNVVQPDILFVKKERLDIIKPKGVYGAPDFVIEILSTNKSYDQKQKYTLYERNGVPEYLIVDPETKQVWHYLLQEQAYQEVLPAHESGRLYINQLGLRIDF